MNILYDIEDIWYILLHIFYNISDIISDIYFNDIYDI